MASCIQISASRTYCAMHHHFAQRNFKLLKSLGSKSYVISPQGNVSFLSRSNVHCANLKVQDTIEKSTIPLVSAISTHPKIQYESLPRSDAKSKSYLAFKKSGNSLIDKKRVEEIQKIIKSKEENQAHPPQSKDPDPLNKATPEQVEMVASVLKKDIPNLFTRHQDYRIYHPHLEFENHIRGTKTSTLPDYVKQLAVVKLLGHLKYAYVSLKVLKLTTHHSEGTIKVRWRIIGLSGLKVFKNFWKYKIWNLQDTAFKDAETWYDGFSIFYVKGDGLVHKHVLLKMQPDEDQEVDTIKPATVIGAKVA
ncbi:hypothetical protein M8J75_009570 [Diaphorina citri]|nr:hypothetical protein M8J75_009570 [Diaphorina citri]